MQHDREVSIHLELAYKNEPATQVTEYAELEARLTNRGAEPLDRLSLWLGKQLLRDNLSLPAGGTYACPLNVGDLVGEVEVELNRQGHSLARAMVSVLPQKLSLEEVGWIKVERLPALLARLDAPNSLRLQYRDDEAAAPFDYISADYTAIKLRRFCRAFLEDGLAAALFNHLHFLTPEEQKREEGFIRGNVRWNPTLQGWLNQPGETGLVHHRTETTRQYQTAANRLLVYFLDELAQDCRRLLALLSNGAPASARLRQGQAEYDEYARALEAGLTGRTRNLPQAQALAGFEPRHPAQWPAIEKSCRAAGQFNPAYRRLAELWQEYASRYVRLPPDPAEQAQAGFQPMSKVYELWAACEIAGALGLRYEGEIGLEKATFSGPGLKLRYNQAAPGGWYSRGQRRQPPRPDLRLELADSGRQIILDVKYRAQSGRAHPEDAYRMLAYMNDLNTGSGAIIYPGEAAGHALRVVAEPGTARQLAELALRPPDRGQSNALEEFQAGLAGYLDQLVNQIAR